MSKENQGKKAKNKLAVKKENNRTQPAIMQQAGLKGGKDKLEAYYTKKGDPMVKVKTGDTKYCEIHYKNKVVKTLSEPLKKP